MTDFKIINFNQSNQTTREATKMNNKVIALPADLELTMSTLNVLKPSMQKGPRDVKLPVGPKTKPSSKHATGTRYSKDYVELVVKFMYEDLLSFQQIAAILNHYGKTTAHGRPFTAQAVRNSVSNLDGWALIEPRWIQWQLDNLSKFND